MPELLQIQNTDIISQAQSGRQLIEQAIIRLLLITPGGLTNAQVARELRLETGLKTGQKNYLTWSILREMTAHGVISTQPKGQGKGDIYVHLNSGDASSGKLPSFAQ